MEKWLLDTVYFYKVLRANNSKWDERKIIAIKEKRDLVLLRKERGGSGRLAYYFQRNERQWRRHGIHVKASPDEFPNDF